MAEKAKIVLDVFLWRVKYVAYKYYLGFKLFTSKHLSQNVAACSFYTLLNFFPLALCVISLVSWFMQDRNIANEYFIEFAFGFLPEIDKNLKAKLIQVMTGDAVALGLNFYNIFFLFLSSLGLFRAITVGVLILSDREVDKTLKLYLKSLLGVAMVLGVFVLQLVVTPIFLSLKGVFKSYDILDGEVKSGIVIFDIAIDLLQYFFNHYWINVFNFSFLFLTMGLVFYIIFGRKQKLRDCLIGSSFFVVTTHFGKNLFWLYITQARSRLVISYGDFFSIVVVIFWIYFLFSVFFYSACLVRVKLPKNLASFKSVLDGKQHEG